MTGPAPDSPQDLAAAYALGALPADEARRFEAFLATSPEAQRELAEYREVAALLALAGSEGAPSTDLRDRVIRGVVARPSRAPLDLSRQTFPAPSRVPWLAVAASLLLAVGIGASLVSTRGRLAATAAALDERERSLAQTEQRLSEREATINSLLEPGVQLFQLTASGDPDPGIQLFWNRAQHRALVHGYRLKPVPAGRAYQLWFIKDGRPVPSVTFRPGADGRAKVEQIPVPDDGPLSAAAITVEPESGSSQPTSPIVLVGSLRKS
jgi:anti-sigma-K factor RskA